MAFTKFIGKHQDRRVCVLFRQVPGEGHMCLIIYPDQIHAHWQDAIQKVLESDMAQQGEEFADALHRSYLPDGRPILETLHQERMIKKVRAADIVMTPNQSSKIRLDELNKMLNEMKQGADAVKRMAENDASRGMVAPEVKRAAEAEFKKQQNKKTAAPATTAPFIARNDAALSDRDIAANMLSQAKRMETEAKALVAEAAKMKKDAERMDPGVKIKTSAATVAVTNSVPLDKIKRTRGPNKTKTVTADATHG